MNKFYNRWALGLSLVSLAVAGLACALPADLPTGLTGDGSLLKDNFSNDDSGWGTGSDEDSEVEYRGGKLEMKVFKSNYFTWSNPNDEKYENIHMEVKVEDNSTDEISTFGMLCHEQVTNSMYYLAITHSGKYAIVKTAVAKDDEVLTNGGDWETSDAIEPGAASYEMAVDCGNGKLALYVNGTKVDEVEDDTYTKGQVGLFAWSGEEDNATEVVFDDFVMTKLEEK